MNPTRRDGSLALPEPKLAWVLSLGGTLFVGFLDYVTGNEVRLFPLYFLPVALAAWRLSRTAAIALSVLSSVCWVGSNWLAGRVYSSAFVWPINFVSQLVAFCVVAVLVSELRRRLAFEESLSRRDPLTGLANGRAFEEQAGLLLAASRRSARPLTLAYLDLDDFKRVNDEGGHHEGDRALVETAGVLMRHCRKSDVVARLGGDEFAILMPDTEADAARTSLERLRSLLAEAMRGNGWAITASLGAVSYARSPPTLDEAIRSADGLMYRAKGGGKNRVHVEVAGTADDAPRQYR